VADLVQEFSGRVANGLQKGKGCNSMGQL